MKQKEYLNNAMRDYIEIIECMNYGVLTEDRGRLDFLLNTYGAKLNARWQAGLGGEPADVQTAVQATAGTDITQKLIGYIASFDPSQNGQYTQWMLLRYLKNGLNLTDLPSAQQYLAVYSSMKAKKQLPAGQNDINSVQTFANLVTIVKQNRNAQLPSKIELKWKATQATEPEQVKAAVAQSPGKSIGDKILAFLSSYDLSSDKRFTFWIADTWLNNGLRLEDIDAAHDYLGMYLEKQNEGEDLVDLDSIETLNDLRDLVAPQSQSKQLAPVGNNAEETKMLAQTEILVNDQYIRILKPLSKAAACYFGRNTEWCTTWGNHTELGLSHPGRNPGRTNNMYDHYVGQGPLFIIEIKPVMSPDNKTAVMPERLYQYHSESGQFGDASDRMLDGPQTRALLQDHPEIMQAIGEDRFARSHLQKLGLKFFSPDALASVNYRALIPAIHSKEDFEAVPESLRHDPEFLARFLKEKTRTAIEIIPKESMTNAVIAELNKSVEDRSQMAKSDTLWDVYDLFPIKLWSPKVIEWATEIGKLTYDQYMQLPPEDRSDAQLQRLIVVTAARGDISNIATYPDGLIHRLGATIEVVRKNPATMQYLSPVDLTEQDLIALADDGVFSYGFNNKTGTLAYLPADRLTDAVVDAVNSTARGHTKLEYGAAGQAQLKQMWVKTVCDYDNRNKIVDFLRTDVPQRYSKDTSFYEDIFETKVAQLRKNYRTPSRDRYGNHITNAGSGGPNQWSSGWLKLSIENNLPITSKMVETFVNALVISEPDKPGAINYDIRNHWHPLLLSLKKYWTAAVIKAALTRKILTPKDVSEDEITPDIAGRIFNLYPEEQQAMAYKADDASLIHEIEHNRRYSSPLIDYIPSDRITEPVAFAAVSTGWVKNAKKRFPKAALSKRVYYAGTPRSFDLKEVPKSVKTDALVLRAVDMHSDQIQYVPDPLEWLNAHRTELKADAHWTNQLERYGFVADKKGVYYRITELPHDDLVNGYVMYKIDQKNGKRWFIYKGSNGIAILTISRNKLGLTNQHASQDLKPVFLDIAKRFLDGVDITVLNRIGIYRNKDGSVYTNEDDEYRNRSSGRGEKKEIDGLEWTSTPHLQGVLWTAWKDSKALISIYKKNYEMYDMKILDHKEALENASAILAGIKKELTWGENPGSIRWQLKEIGIEWSGTTSWGKAKSGSMWLSRQTQVGKIGKFTVFYAPSHRYITIWDNEGLAANGTVLMKGTLTKDHVAWRISEKDKASTEVLKKTMDSLAGKVKDQDLAKKTKK